MSKTMSKTWKIFVEFLRLKAKEISDLFGSGTSAIGDNFGAICTFLLWLIFVTLFIISFTSSSFILQFFVYYVLFLMLALFSIVVLTAIALGIQTFCSWIKDNWKQATINVERSQSLNEKK